MLSKYTLLKQKNNVENKTHTKKEILLNKILKNKNTVQKQNTTKNYC